MVAVFVGLVAYGLFFFSSQREINKSEELNAYVYQDQLEELKKELERGAISKQFYEQEVDDIYQRIIEESKAREAAAPKVRTPILVSVLLLCLIPAIAFLIYWKIGNPSLASYSGSQTASRWDANGNFIYSGSKQPTEKELTAYLKESPKDVRAWLRLSEILYSSGKTSEALSALDNAFENSKDLSNDPSMIARRALVMLEVDERANADKANSELDRALRIEPQNVQALEIKALLAFSRHQYSEAINAWSKLLEIYPSGSKRANELIDAVGEAKSRLELGL